MHFGLTLVRIRFTRAFVVGTTDATRVPHQFLASTASDRFAIRAGISTKTVAPGLKKNAVGRTSVVPVLSRGTSGTPVAEVRERIIKEPRMKHKISSIPEINHFPLDFSRIFHCSEHKFFEFAY